jgi:hypothetical protein
MAFTELEKNIIIYGQKNGKTESQVREAIARARLGLPAQQAPAPAAPVEPVPLANKITDTLGLKGTTDYLGKVLSFAPGMHQQGTEQNLEKPTTMEAIGAGLQVGSLLLPAGKVPGLPQATNFIGRLATGAVTGFGSGALYGQGKTLAEGGTVAEAGKAGLVSGIVGAPIGATAEGVLGGVLGPATNKPAQVVQKESSILADAAQTEGKNLRNELQVVLGKRNANPQLESAATRLSSTENPSFLKGTQRLSDPVASYDQYLAQSKKAITDIKVDPAISQVGEKIGNAFDAVVAQRRAVGEVMGSELKKIGGVQTKIDESIQLLASSLKDSGVEYDAAKHALVAGKTSKFAAEDIDLLTQYLRELDSLGSNPTIAELDGFLSRTAGLVDNFKSGKGIVNTTNGERIIKQSQASLRDQFSPTKTGNPELQAYYDARKAYSDLSNFLDEGGSFLGKKTASGDYARDASLAKSSVQSVLNNGKKDWLVKLEQLTGYPALDDSVLALQAMKDAGDFRGQSLLQLMSEGSVPTNTRGFTQKLLDAAIEKGSEIVGGKPEERTRAYLQSLMKGK